LNKKDGIIKYLLIFFIVFLLLHKSEISASNNSLPWEENFKEGVLLLGEGKYKQAIEQFQKVIAVCPQNAYSHYYIGKALMGIGEFNKAIDSFDKAIQLDPLISNAYLGKGICLYKLGRYNEALELLEQAIKLKPDYGEAFFYKGLIYFNQKNYVSCYQNLQKCIQLNPDFTSTCSYYIEVAKKHIAKSREAKKSLSEFDLKTIPKKWEFFFTLGGEYDDNVILQPEKEPLPGAISRKEDFRSLSQLRIDYKKHLEEGQFALASSFYHLAHHELSEYDLLGGSISIAYLMNGSKLNPSIEYGYDYYVVGGDQYLDKHSISPSLTIATGKNINTQLYCLFEKTNFFPYPVDKEDDRDSLSGTFGSRIFIQGKNNRTVNIETAYKVNKADGSNWDYQSPMVSAQFKTPFIFKNSNFSFLIMSEWLLFDHVNTLFNKTRNDTRIAISGTISFHLNKNWDLIMTFTNIRNMSNLEAYDYKRNISSISVSSRF